MATRALGSFSKQKEGRDHFILWLPTLIQSLLNGNMIHLWAICNNALV